MAEQVARRKAKEFQLVIAGDLFDFSRTTLWFSDELRPYVSLENVNEPLEQKVLGILDYWTGYTQHFEDEREAPK